MGEHDNLETVIRHVAGHGRIGRHHVAAELFVLALDGQIAPRVPGPLIEGCRRVLAQPRYEVLSYLVIDNRIRVWGGSQKQIDLFEIFRSVYGSY
jgi:hypothetical protein